MALQRAWLQRGGLARLLWPLSLVYGGLAAARRLLYRLHVLRTQAIAVPVIVVGNVIAGGSGKTPAEMSPDELSAALDRLKRELSDRSTIVIEAAAEPGETGVFD